MIEILPIKLLTDTDGPIFGNLNVALGKLNRLNFKVGSGIVVTAPEFVLRTTIEHFDFGSRDVYEQTLTLVKKEIEKISFPQILIKETGKNTHFFYNHEQINSADLLWLRLLQSWFDEIKSRIWRNGFYKGVAENLEPQTVIFAKNIKVFGSAFFDPVALDTALNATHGKLHPSDLKEVDQIVREANKKLFIPHVYEWILDKGIKLVGIKPYTPSSVIANQAPALSEPVLSEVEVAEGWQSSTENDKKRSATKIFLDFSTGLIVDKNVDLDSTGIDGIYIVSEKIFDLNKPGDSFEDLVFRLVESAITFPSCPVLFKLADKSEGPGKVRGALRLLHQNSLFDPMIKALDFARHKKGLLNIHIVIPFVRGANELLEIKRALSAKKLTRKSSLQIWMEIAVPENIINLEDYLTAGIDGVVLNLDELVAYLNGFDISQADLAFYKNEVDGLIKFLRDTIKLLHKSKIPFIAYGGLNLHPKVLEFLVENGVHGIVVENSWSHSAKDLLYQVERRMILRRT